MAVPWLQHDRSSPSCLPPRLAPWCLGFSTVGDRLRSRWGPRS